MSDTLNQLLRAIILAPDEDTPRLMYADELDERGQHHRARMIREMVKRPNARITVSRPVPGNGPSPNVRSVGIQFPHLGSLCRAMYWHQIEVVGINRGFVDSVKCHLDHVTNVARTYFWSGREEQVCPDTAQPIRLVRLPDVILNTGKQMESEKKQLLKTLYPNIQFGSRLRFEWK